VAAQGCVARESLTQALAWCKLRLVRVGHATTGRIHSGFSQHLLKYRSPIKNGYLTATLLQHRLNENAASDKPAAFSFDKSFCKTSETKLSDQRIVDPLFGMPFLFISGAIGSL
jgi:hypothetical protein